MFVAQRRLCVCGFLTVVLTLPAGIVSAQETDVPEPLEPWVDWVMHGHEQSLCPAIGNSVICLWPGVLDVRAEPKRGAFSFEFEADRELFVAIPGTAQQWPQQVVLDGRSVPVITQQGRPVVRVTEGQHRLSGVIPWVEIPETLVVPPTTALVSLQVRGQSVPRPRVEDGVLWLQAGEGVESAEDRLDLDVFRHIDDGVPLRIITRLELRVAGKAREVDLGSPLLAGTVPMALQSGIPARLDEDGHLIVQVISGTWTVQVTARTTEPPASLVSPERSEPWPEHETWVFAADEQLRTVNLSGAPGVDPARTALPDEWRSLPAYLMEQGAQLDFEEIRRGEPQPPPDQISLHRNIWLDGDGQGLTFRDTFSGTMHEGWRLNMLAPGELGHASTYAGDVLVTEGEQGLSGVELRESAIRLEADSRTEQRGGALPAVGWDHDVQMLSAALNLPPGWVLVTATGVDELPGTWADQWSLLDLFFLLITVLVISKLAGWRWGALAMVAVGLSFQADGAPTNIWLFLLVALALERVLGSGKLRVPVLILRWIAVLSVVLVLLPFLVSEVKYSLFPVTEDFGWGYMDSSFIDIPDRFVEMNLEAPQEVGGWEEEQDWGDKDGRGEGKKMERALKASSITLSDESQQSYRSVSKLSLANQQNAMEVVQTGPGIPVWNWRSWQLQWSGPVSADHRIRLFVAGPLAVGAVRLARVLLMILLALRLALGAGWQRRLRWKGGGGPRAAAAATALLAFTTLGAASAQEPEAPRTEVLDQLRTRLLEPPACRPDCVSAAELQLQASGNTLRVVAEVHAGAEAAWSVPGPAATWVPGTVRVDGVDTSSIVRMGDGFLYVRLSPGVHEIVAEGPVPTSDALALQFGQVPHRVTWSGDGWIIDGLREDGTVGASVQLARLLQAGHKGPEGGTAGLPPWLEITRELEIGMPWKAITTVRRVGASRAPVVVRVPLLDGESVTDEGVRVEKGEVLVSLGRDDDLLQWTSLLQETDSLVLTAPTDVPWTEVWSIATSPIYSFDAQGIPPIEHTSGGQWWPRWRPWPGESLTVAFARPTGVEGQSITVDDARLDVRPGIRMTASQLDLTVRSSRGGKLPLILPDGARVQTVTIDGQPYPVKPEETRIVLPLEPGRQVLHLAWQREEGLGLAFRVPEVTIGSSAVNARVSLQLPGSRWIVAAPGPGRGPAVLWWVHVAWILIVSLLLGRTKSTPLKTIHWFLLGIGMTQIPVVLPLAVVGWLLLVGYRRSRPPGHPVAFNFLQAGVVISTLVALVVLYAAVHAGLLFAPDMQIAGEGSWDTSLNWYVDRIDGTMPRPLLLSFPLWVWRVLMLLWALWMAASLVRWLRWGWGSFSSGGLVKWPLTVAKTATETAVETTNAGADLADDAEGEPEPQQ